MKILDLSYTVEHDLFHYPGDPDVKFKQFCTVGKEGYNVTEVSMATHSGTHIDAPAHFIDSGITIDKINLSICFGKASLIDMSHKKELEEITVEDLEPFKDIIQPGARIIFRTDWSRYFKQMKFFTKAPGISIAAAHWLVEREIALLGTDTPSLHAKLFQEVHQIILRGGIVVIESLINLDKLNGHSFSITALPLKLQGLDGSPVRAIAIIDKGDNVSSC